MAKPPARENRPARAPVPSVGFPPELRRRIEAWAARHDPMLGFSEAVPEGPWTPEEARERVERRLAERCVYLWQDEQPRSMCLHTLPTEHGITVTGVYTPPTFRRQGYATSCVASLSHRLLDEGYQYCTLYTDLSNPTSNSVYQKIGYRPVRASAMIGFVR